MNEPRNAPTRIERLASLLEPRFPLRLLGFGLIYVWSSCVWEMPILTQTRASVSTGYLFDIWLLSAFLTPAACIACAIAGRKRELADHGSLFVIAPLLASLGTVCIALYPYASELLRTALSLAASIGTGIGPALMVVLWVGLYSKLDIDLTETVVPASFLVIIICMLIIPYLPTALASPIAVLLPLVSAALLLISNRAVKTGAIAAREPVESGEETSPYPLSSMTRIFLLILVAYAISCTIPALHPAATTLIPGAVANIVGMLFAIAVSIAIVMFSARIDLGVYFRWMSTPMILSIVFTAFSSPLAATISTILANAMFTSLEIIMVLYFIRLAHKTNRPSSFFIGIGACATYTGLLIGYLLGAEWATLSAQGALGIQSYCLILIGVFSIAMLLVPRNDSAWSGGGQLESKQTADEPQKTFEALCNAIALKHALSKRETDVFKLLAQGRSQPYIRDALFLSKNTVSTHIRHIYRKLDIHSKEELIDLVEKI